MTAPKLPRFSNGNRPMTPEEFVVECPFSRGWTVDYYALAELLERLHYLELRAAISERVATHQGE